MNYLSHNYDLLDVFCEIKVLLVSFKVILMRHKVIMTSCGT